MRGAGCYTPSGGVVPAGCRPPARVPRRAPRHPAAAGTLPARAHYAGRALGIPLGRGVVSPAVSRVRLVGIPHPARWGVAPRTAHVLNSVF